MKVLEALQSFYDNQNCFAANLTDKLKVVSEGPGICLLEFKVEDEHVNMYKTLHGGLTATLVDIVTSAIVMTLRDGHGVSVDLNVSYMTAAKLNSTILIEAKVLKAGARMLFLNCDLKDKETGKMVAQGRHTKFIG